MAGPATDLAPVNALLAEYAAALDERRYDDWLGLFATEASYVLQPRENFDRGLPLATMRLESRGMIADRLYGIQNTLFHQPYYQRHVIGVARPGSSPPVVDDAVPVNDELGMAAHANYAVFRTRTAQPSEVFNVGRYLMQLVEEQGRPRIRRMLVVFDSELVPNSLIYPV